jgi:hypothetical protein
VDARSRTDRYRGEDEAAPRQRRRYAAQTGDDFATMARLFADDLVSVHACGAVDGKNSFRGADRESPRPK